MQITANHQLLQTRTPRLVAESLVSPNMDTRCHDELVQDLSQLPLNLLERLHESQLQFEVTDKKDKIGQKEGGGDFVARTRRINIDRDTLFTPAAMPTITHEIGHAIDFNKFEKSSTVGFMLKLLVSAKARATKTLSDTPQFSRLYQVFQARTVAGMAAAKRTESGQINGSKEEAGISFSDPFLGAGFFIRQPGTQADLLVLPKGKGHDPLSSYGGSSQPWNENLGNIQVVNDAKGVTVVLPKNVSQTACSWTADSNYLASTNRKEELFAEGVSAFLTSDESRQRLAQQEPELHQIIESSLNEFLLAK